MFKKVQTHDTIQPGDPVSSRNSIGNHPKECNDFWGTAELLDSSIYRRHSSLSDQRSAYSVNSPRRTIAKAVEQYHSLPLSMLNQAQMDTSNGYNSAEHIGIDIDDQSRVFGLRHSEKQSAEIVLITQGEQASVVSLAEDHGIDVYHCIKSLCMIRASYDVGGQTISIDTIQSSILGCRLPRPGQWLRFLFPSKTKFKVGVPRRAYAIECAEPHLHFALCSGSYSDPAVRIYTPKNVFEEIEVAKEEYIQASWSVNKEQKIMLPKLMDYFAKDPNVCSAGLLQMVEQFMPDSLRKNLQPSCKRKTGKTIEWISHNFAFRYLFSKELAQ
ncbi:hypothetical protein F3Y22_tig00005712pilonHSYRG00059 [Hibiscus syriacus]|uniref:DUF547 domain-containing protein n=1 Tax=Hibiscus syriacus TaxID=106335 RepID=A0A6A3CIW7_HIBSY|nr:hypothetical protein F3Y22_tig00005712pilonHSYRG00059 [Hibiscus syriacus]